MKRTILIIATCGFAIAAATAAIVSGQSEETDPFANMFAMTWQDDWNKDQLVGIISDYQSPIFVRDMPDVDWGAQSVHFETELPLAHDFRGTFVDDRLQLYCYQHALSAIIENIETIPKSAMPAEVLEAALSQATDISRYPEGADQVYIRQCYATIKPRHPEDDVSLMDRCAEAIRTRLGSVDDLQYDVDRNKFYLLHVAPVDFPSGMALGTQCEQTTHPSGIFNLYNWYLPSRI